MISGDLKNSYKSFVSNKIASGEITPNKGMELWNEMLSIEDILKQKCSTKTLEEIKDDLAKECGEDSFDVLLQSEISVGDMNMAKHLLDTSTYRYLIQFEE